MSKCPNCNYELVLLEHRQKYKCPKCSRLYPQIEIERRDFVEFNKRHKGKQIRKSFMESLTNKNSLLNIRRNKMLKLHLRDGMKIIRRKC